MPRRLLKTLAACLLALLLAGCWVPERYIARLKIERDGTYRLTVEGTAVHPETFRAMRPVTAEAGRLKPEDLKKRQVEVLAPLLKELEQLKSDQRITEANSIGDGRVRFTLDGTWRLDRGVLVSSELLAPLAYSVGPDGTLRLRMKDAVVSREAVTLGLASEGDLSIVLAEGIEVLEHNAQRAPSSPRGAYRWHIETAGSPEPFLRIRLPAPVDQGAQKRVAHH